MEYDSGIKLAWKYIFKVFPEVSKNFDSWGGIWKESKDEILGKLALSSINDKKFHAREGSVYALYPYADLKRAVKFIVALQTISDYLNNLCDRAGIENESAFRQLYLSMLDAVDPKRPLRNYYKFCPYKNDCGYLQKLVEECRLQIQDLPSYDIVMESVKNRVHLYTDLHTYKHLSQGEREGSLKTWANYYLSSFPGMYWWEFCAATESTLGIFVLFAAAFNPSLTHQEVKDLDCAYFPWICGLHMLLAYYIDAQEDMRMGYLNFTYYYSNLKRCEERLVFFVEKSLEECNTLNHPGFHVTVIRGLLAMYLSDWKASQGLNRIATRNILKINKSKTAFYHSLYKFLRLTGII